jgi:hypothetical protein
MAKASQSLHAVSASLNRRKLIAGSVTVVVAGAAVSPSGRTAPPLTARPSKLGLAFIAAVKEYNTASKGGLSDAKADAAWNRLHMKIRPLRESIEEQPVTLSSLVDRAIVAAHDCSPGKGWTDQPGIVSLVRAVCGLAGVDPTDAML